LDQEREASRGQNHVENHWGTLGPVTGVNDSAWKAKLMGDLKVCQSSECRWQAANKPSADGAPIMIHPNIRGSGYYN
jgi:hypothetical protein